MWVKICANTTLHDAQLALAAGADAVGFVFAPSKRRVTAEAVSDIVGALPRSSETVGVFNTDDPFEIEHIVASSGLKAAQLHRPFDADFVHTLSREFGGELKIIQTVAWTIDAENRPATDAAFTSAVRAAASHPAVWAVLIDAAKSGISGGLGLAFDWAHVGRLVKEALPDPPAKRIILAGGLRPDSVSEAIRSFHPWGVDVASGVESTPGTKDPGKLRAFVSSARSA